MTARTNGAQSLRAGVQSWLMRLRDFLTSGHRRQRPTLRLEELPPHLLRDIGLADGTRFAFRRCGRLDALRVARRPTLTRRPARRLSRVIPP
jgi:uncharacterized protein YjiS (DUF1127 family)